MESIKKLRELSAVMFNPNNDSEEKKKMVLATEGRRPYFISDRDFDLILDEETGKVVMATDHYCLTEEDHEEMERLEADNNFHASLYETDCLPY